MESAKKWIRVAADKKWQDMKKFDRWKTQFRPRRIFIFIAVFVWAVVLWGGIIGSIFFQSMHSYISYFTNWSWTYQGIFWILYLFSFLEHPKSRMLEYELLYTFWWNMLAQTVIVFVLVIAIFQDDASIIIDETKTGGGKYSDGTVLNVNMIKHYFPVIFNCILLFAIWNDIADMLIYTFADIVYYGSGADLCDCCTRFRYHARKIPAWIYIGFQTFVSVVPILVYYNVFDITVIYNLDDFPIWAGILIIIFFAFAAVFLPLQYMFRITIAGKSVDKCHRGCKETANLKEGDSFQLKAIPVPSDF
jgi:hypothetical protein